MLKQLVKDLVKEKMLKEREDILNEMKQGGGLIVKHSGKQLRIGKGRACGSCRKRERDRRG